MTSLLLLTQAALAADPAVIVWAAPAVPDETLRGKAERRTGPARHLAWGDLALGPTPWVERDESARANLEKVIAASRERWDGFDIETTLARELAEAAGPVEVLRDDADRALLVQASILAGAAALRAAAPAGWAVDPTVAPFRAMIGERAFPAALVQAVALEPARAFTRADVPDAATLASLEQIRAQVATLPPSSLRIAPLPSGVSVMLDGRPLSGSGPHPLAAGRHYLHLLKDGVVQARQVFSAEPGLAVSFAPWVGAEDMESMRVGVVESPKPTVDGPLAVAIRARSAGAPIFVAAVDPKGKPAVRAWENGAAFKRPPLLNGLFTTTIGTSSIASRGFVGHEGEKTTTDAYAGSIDFSGALAWFGVYGGASLHVTPDQLSQFSTGGGTQENLSLLAQPYAGGAVYLPRPARGNFFAMVGAHVGWLAPGAKGTGVRAGVGVPLGRSGNWLRADWDRFDGVQQTDFPGEGEATTVQSIRVGFSSVIR
jgi:hypothetical protein